MIKYFQIAFLQKYKQILRKLKQYLSQFFFVIIKLL